MSERKKAKLFLIHSSEWRDSCAHRADVLQVFHRSWCQIELFPTSSPETLVFIKPDEGDLLETIRQAGARHVLDLRDVPYLTLAGFDRESFFGALRNLLVDYVGIHTFVHEARSSSVDDFLSESLTAQPRGQSLLENYLVQKLATGPTVVMCDDEPARDAKVGALLDLLSKKQVRHKPVLTEQ